jgi:hypothetical protein
VKHSGLLDKPFERGSLYDRSGPEWGSVDLRNGTPLGDLFEALLDLFHEAFRAFPLPVVDRPPGRPPFSEQVFAVLELRDDYAKARERWPGEKLKPLCRLMCKHFTRYRTVNPDALRKRISQMLLKEEEQAKAWDTLHKALGPLPLPLTLQARQLAKRIEGRNEQKKSALRRGKN